MAVNLATKNAFEDFLADRTLISGAGTSTRLSQDFTTDLRVHLKAISGESNERGDNGADALRDLQAWIADLKETDGVQDVFEVFMEEKGLEAIVGCMQRNKSDTIVATRALEILAGETSSNSSLPVLEDQKTCRMLLHLDLDQDADGVQDFVSVLMDILQCPDLQSVSRGLGCRALRFVSASTSDPQFIASINDHGGLQVLLQQVDFVQRPAAFGCLGELAIKDAATLAKLRAEDSIKIMLLSRFAAAPDTFNPADDPAAAKFFLHVWSMRELKDGLQLALQVEEGEVAEHEAYKQLASASEKKYALYSMYTDVILPFVDLGSDVVSMCFYFIDEKYAFFCLTTGACAFTTMYSTVGMSAANPPVWKYVANVLTLGTFSLCEESRSSYTRGFRTEALAGMKMFASVESMTSFFVGIASLLTAGYIEGYGKLEGFALYSRWFAVASSMLLLPEVSYSIVCARTLHGKKEFGLKYLNGKRDSGYWNLTLVLYQASEVWSMMTYVVIVILFLPLGGLYFIGTYALCVHLSVLISCRKLAAIFPVPLTLLFNMFGGPNSDIQSVSRQGAVWRLLSLAAAWTLIFSELFVGSVSGILHSSHFGGDPESDLAHDFLEDASLHVMIIAFTGTVLHFIFALQQLLAGRWTFDLYTPDQQGEYSRLMDTAEAHGAGGVVQSGRDSVATALERWQKVHQYLPSATARVDREAYIKVHEVLMAEKNPGEEKNERFLTYINALFDAATALMYPKRKLDLGKHCFGYSTLLFNEYSVNVDDAGDGLGLATVPAMGWFDPLSFLRSQLHQDWADVRKDENGLVDREAMIETLLKRHNAKFGGVAEAKEAYTEFLGKLFEACVQLRLDATKLDNRCFLYAAFIAYEFYYSDARDKEMAAGCGSSTPVADNLCITAAVAPTNIGRAKMKKKAA